MAGSKKAKPVPEAKFPSDPFGGASPYDVLGVRRDTDVAGIRSAFRAIQRRSAGDETSIAGAREAMEALTRPRRRLAIDLLTVHEERLHREIVRRYGDVTFELTPADPAPLLMKACDLAWSEPAEDFEVPEVPKVVFESMIPAPPRDDELVVPDRNK